MPLVFVNIRDWEWKMLVPQGKEETRGHKRKHGRLNGKGEERKTALV